MADAVSAGRERFRFLLNVVCMMGVIFLGRILPDGVGGWGYPPPMMGDRGARTSAGQYEYVRPPDEYAKKSMQYARKTGAIPKNGNKTTYPPYKGNGV